MGIFRTFSDFILYLLLFMISNDISSVFAKCHSSTQEEPSPEECPVTPKELDSYSNCYEIGCTAGSNCQSEDLKNRKCCLYTNHGVTISCCLSRNPKRPCSQPEVTKPPLRPQTLRPESKCSSITYLNSNENCIEIGCVLGTSCLGDANSVCCPHLTSTGVMISCCLQESSTALPATTVTEGSTARWIPEGYECVEAGCDEGQNCVTPGITDQMCGLFYVDLYLETCCIRKIPEITTTKNDDSSCSPYEVPKFYNCLEIGCVVGSTCRTKGAETRKCCRHVYETLSVTCCLQKPDTDDQLTTATSLLTTQSTQPYTTGSSTESSLLVNCFEIGCSAGDPCRTKGMENQKCCKHLINGRMISCCLSDEVNEPVTSPSPSIICPPRVIPPNLHCMEIGCTQGNKCTVLGLRHQFCCAHEVNGNQVTCCLAKPADTVPDTHLETTTKALDDIPPDCPKALNSNFMIRCTEQGCKVGTKCTQTGLEDCLCCPFIFAHKQITCCVKVEEQLTTAKSITTTELAQPLKDGGPPIFYPVICSNIGCGEGGSCPAENGDKCSIHIFSEDAVSCCSKHNFPLAVNIPFCSSINIPEGCYCMEIGCSLGHGCMTPGLEHQSCCPYKVSDIIVSCCLAKHITDNSF